MNNGLGLRTGGGRISQYWSGPGRVDPRGLHAGARYVPFVVERLLGLFFYTEAGRRYRIIKYRISQMKGAEWAQEQRRATTPNVIGLGSFPEAA